MYPRNPKPPKNPNRSLFYYLQAADVVDAAFDFLTSPPEQQDKIGAFQGHLRGFLEANEGNWFANQEGWGVAVEKTEAGEWRHCWKKVDSRGWNGGWRMTIAGSWMNSKIKVYLLSEDKAVFFHPTKEGATQDGVVRRFSCTHTRGTQSVSLFLLLLWP